MRQVSLFTLAFALAACASEHDRSLGDPPARATTARVSAESAEVDVSARAAASGGPAAPLVATVVVSASPASTPPSPPPQETGDRIYAKARFVWIQAAPRPSKGWLGYLGLGGSVRLRGTIVSAKEMGPGCDAWYKVEPTGYVCLDPSTTTLDPNDPEYLAIRAQAGDVTSPFPFEYGESLQTPRYREVPTPSEQRTLEWDLEVHRRKIAALATGPATRGYDARYLGLDLSPAGVPMPPMPTLGPLVREARATVAIGSTVAWSHAYDAGERTWLYTSDHMLVPKDRVKPYPRSTYRGVVLGGEVRLPIAFFREKNRPKLRREGDRFVETGESFDRLGWIMLTGVSASHAGARMLETTETGVWIREKDAAIAAAQRVVPYKRDEEIGRKRSWVDVSVLGGTLVAYEDARPVFATLVSSGRGGVPFKGRDPVSTASTPTGTFRVDGKFRTATMTSSTDSSIVHAEVQYVQNFHGPHALHGAYWHDAWGELKSGGCVNLSPIDSQWLFDWTEPRIPDGWHGVRSVSSLGAPTRVVVRP